MEAWDEEEEELDNSQNFQVNLVILEARHLSMTNSDCKVEVTIGKQKKTIRSRTAKTDAPYFNEFCIFNFYQPLSVLLDMIMDVKIYGVPRLLKSRLIGGFSVELSTVWVQPNHQFYHKWATLVDAQNPTSGIKGYLKCDIEILAQGTKRKPTELDPGDVIEDHLLVPHGEVSDRQRAKFIFSIFRADNFADITATQAIHSLYAYVKITYGGKSATTSIAENTFEPLWNEELAFDDMVPALCQYVHIELCDAYKTKAGGILGSANLDLRQLSHESEKGFLPTYGPVFLYLYEKHSKMDRQNRCPYVNYSFTYMCRLLMALRTEIVDYAEDVLVKKKRDEIKPKRIRSVVEEQYFQYREFIFFAAVFDIILFDSGFMNSRVSVRVNIGPQKPIKDEQALKSVGDMTSYFGTSRNDEYEFERGRGMHKKSAVTFEGDDGTSRTMGKRRAFKDFEDAEAPREEDRNEELLKTLHCWPKQWPEDNKLGKEINERLQNREETKFGRWKQEKKRNVEEWLADWRKRKREKESTSGDGTAAKHRRWPLSNLTGGVTKRVKDWRSERKQKHLVEDKNLKPEKTRKRDKLKNLMRGEKKEQKLEKQGGVSWRRIEPTKSPVTSKRVKDAKGTADPRRKYIEYESSDESGSTIRTDGSATSTETMSSAMSDASYGRNRRSQNMERRRTPTSSTSSGVGRRQYDTASTTTSGDEFDDDDETMSEGGRSVSTESDRSSLSQVTRWPRDFTPDESLESSSISRRQGGRREENLMVNEPYPGRSSSVMSREIRRTNYSDYSSKNPSAESSRYAMNDIYGNLENEEEVLDEEEEVMKRSSGRRPRSRYKKAVRRIKGKKVNEKGEGKYLRRKGAKERKSMRKQELRDMKRSSTLGTNKATSVFSPAKRTKANAQVYVALNDITRLSKLSGKMQGKKEKKSKKNAGAMKKRIQDKKQKTKKAPELRKKTRDKKVKRSKKDAEPKKRIQNKKQKKSKKDTADVKEGPTGEDIGPEKKRSADVKEGPDREDTGPDRKKTQDRKQGPRKKSTESEKKSAVVIKEGQSKKDTALENMSAADVKEETSKRDAESEKKSTADTKEEQSKKGTGVETKKIRDMKEVPGKKDTELEKRGTADMKEGTSKKDSELEKKRTADMREDQSEKGTRQGIRKTPIMGKRPSMKGRGPGKRKSKDISDEESGFSDEDEMDTGKKRWKSPRGVSGTEEDYEDDLDLEDFDQRFERESESPLDDMSLEEDGSDEYIHIRHVRVYNGCNSTRPQTVSPKAHYAHAVFSGKFPCLHVNGEWPDALRRMYRSNVIQQSIVHFTKGINDVLNELTIENRIEASEKLKKLFSDVSADCREILRLTARIEPEDTNLYRERKRYYHQEIEEIIMKMELASMKTVLVAEDELNRAYGYLSTLKRFAQDPEDSFPDTEIWLIKDGKRVAQHRMHTRKVVFSPNSSERGVRSGKIQSVIVRGKSGNIVAKLEMFMWFGPGSQFFECRKMLPSGYVFDDHHCPGTGIIDVPLLLHYTEIHYYLCRVHLFQARITAGADISGLADPFVRVTVVGHQLETRVERETLNPTWDESIVFPKLKIYGSPDYFKDNSITVFIEVFDLDYLTGNELIGRALIKPPVWLSTDSYSPPKLAWKGLRRDCSETGKILLATELLELSAEEAMAAKPKPKILGIPEDIRPRYVGHRLEVLFWGVRELKKRHGGGMRVFVTLECGGKTLSSPLLTNVSKDPNFPGTIQTLRLNLPDEHEYKPPLILKLFHTGSFVMKETYTGNCIIPSVKIFFLESADDEERKLREIEFLELLRESKRLKLEKILEKEELEKEKKKTYRVNRVKEKITSRFDSVYLVFKTFFLKLKCKLGLKCKFVEIDHPIESQEEEGLDWWVKYYSSKEPEHVATDAERLVIYDSELENQPEFHGFSDVIYTFNMVKGKVQKEGEKSILTGKVKAAVKLYRWPLEEGSTYTLYGADIRRGLLKEMPKNHPIKYVVRVYVVACKNLTPKDVFGKSDPYLFLQVGNQKISDNKEYIPKQVNPIFGKSFEFNGIFPDEHLLTIKVLDHDILGDDDLIGETVIDLETRYYTKHHASCGISQTYSTKGYTAWRDVLRPSELLSAVCRQSNMPPPVYSETGVIVGEYEFRGEPQMEKHRKEVHALAALKSWHEIPLRGFKIVPEHVETRPLYHPLFPGVEQGKIEMWVDIFPADFRFIPPMVDIKPQEPVDMELRAIVWNVENVILDDTTLLFNEKMSDIYVRGWLNALEDDKQSTDVHYRSMNGEGNFNWRFVFPFKYVSSERRLVVHKKSNLFDIEPELMKFPCRLELQVWDNDFIKDDFLGSLNLELCAMPRGAKLSTRCKLSMFEDSTPKINLFKVRRTRGWWPFRRIADAESSEYNLTGKIDLELEVVTGEQAAEFPVGKGREEPRALPEPKRPASSFIWFLNPLKTCRYIICRKYGKYLLIILLIVMVVVFFLLGIYALPGYLVKRMVGA